MAVGGIGVIVGVSVGFGVAVGKTSVAVGDGSSFDGMFGAGLHAANDRHRSVTGKNRYAQEYSPCTHRFLVLDEAFCLKLKP